MVRRLLGVSAEEAHQEVSDRGQYVKLRWLHERFSELAASDNVRDAVYAAQAYLVYILGCTLFTDKTGDQINCNYLRLFDDTEEFEGYAWGAAALAFSTDNWESPLGPQQNDDYRAGQPYAMRWAQQAHGAVSEDAVKAFRAQLDTLRAEDWESHKLSPERRGRVAHPAWACSLEYLQWYCYISHPRVQNEAADPLIDPLLTVSPWDGIQSAIGYLDHLVTRWRVQDPDISLPYVMSHVEEAFEMLNFCIGQHGQPTGGRGQEQGESSSRRRCRRD
ncbi:hypothetical protein C2S52_001250 [Perilla frutescens var. hirtella]|nr:hypothetical protein C2S51_007233 [Perilla frutescens var. frutescens]KAH6800786.1 hypothetical protein C2S52_001250 [Perilla frutescens var. hirtella]